MKQEHDMCWISALVSTALRRLWGDHCEHTHHDSHSFPVSDKVHVGLPALPLDDLGGGAGVVHGMGRHQVMSIRWPAEPQHMGCPSTLKETPVLKRKSRPTLWPKLDSRINLRIDDRTSEAQAASDLRPLAHLAASRPHPADPTPKGDGVVVFSF